jgi:hypothetical protein
MKPSERIDRETLEAKRRANDAKLAHIVNAPPLDRIMLAKREDELRDEQENIEFELGREIATPFDPQKVVDDYRSMLALL